MAGFGRGIGRRGYVYARGLELNNYGISHILPNRFDLISRLRNKNSDLQVITITSNATAKIRKKAAKMGVLFHSTKPKHLYQLRNIVDVTLEFESRRARRACV